MSSHLVVESWPECLGKELKSEQSRYSTRHSDIWSLGIIIINIITGLAMWRSANSTDEGFENYIRNPDTIRFTHPISHGVANIMKRIFIINPLARITLVELREEIVKLDTFFMSEQDLLRAPLSVREAAVNYSASSFPYSDTLCPCDHETYGVIEDEVPEEQYLFPSPGTDAYYSYLSHSAPRFFSPTHEEHVVVATLPIGKRANNHSGGSSSSGADSDGKVTPETHAVNPAVEVPGFAEWESLDHSVVFPEALYVAWNTKLPTQPPGLFKSAVQRVKAKVQNFCV
jgi:serine/threonine protein kinase